MNKEKNFKTESEDSDEKELYTQKEIKEYKTKWLYFEVIPINTEWAFGVGIIKDNRDNLKVRVIKGRFYENLVIPGEPGKVQKVDLSAYPQIGITKSRGKIKRVETQIPISQALKFQIKRTSDILPLIPIILKQLSEREKFLDQVDISTRKKNMYKEDFIKSTTAGLVLAEIKHKLKAILED